MATLLAKIEDKEVLDFLAERASAHAMRLAAARKAGAFSWEEIFQTASNKSKDLGDALAAVELFSKVQSDAKEAVQQAALTLIRLGDEQRIPEMVDLLEDYGDKQLAEDYLNCGQPDLDTAGRQWASQRGYNIGSGHGSNRADWGRP